MTTNSMKAALAAFKAYAEKRRADAPRLSAQAPPCHCDQGLKIQLSPRREIVAEVCRCARCGECDDNAFWLNPETDRVEHCSTCAPLIRGAALLTQSQIPARYRHCRLGSFRLGDAVMDAHAAATGLAHGLPTWLHGQAKYGKTHLLVGAIFEGVRAGRAFLYRSWHDVCARYRLRSYDYDHARLELLTDIGAHLVLDDIGPKDRLTDAHFVELVRRRYDRELPLSLASRLTPKELGATLGEVVTSLPDDAAVGPPPPPQ